MSLSKIAFSVLMVHCQIQSAHATNLWFMPGDACFPAVLDKSFAEEFGESKHNLRVDYASLRGGGYFCGYAGFDVIEIQDVPDVWSDRIREIYTALRVGSPRRVEQEFDTNGKVERETESNGFLMFVQNGSFDIDKFQLGFRYNEDWRDDFPGDKNRSYLYQPYFAHRSDIIEDWGNSKHVSPLKVQFPEPDKSAPTDFENRFDKGTMTGSAKDLMLVILPDENLERHLLRQSSNVDFISATESRKGLGPLIVMNAKGVWLYRRDKERIYRATPWNKTLNIHGSYEE